MKITKYSAFLISALMFAFFAISCDDNTTDPDPVKEKPNAPTNLMALSVNETTIHLKYDISTSETNTLFQDYFLTYNEVGSTSTKTMAVAKGVNPIIVPELSEGKIYEFKLVARYTNGEVSATAATVKWSPAARFELTVNDAPIRVYETASSFGSGLQIYYATENGPRARTIANSGDWDLGIRTEGMVVNFGSATKLNYNYSTTPQPTFILTDYFLANSLNAVFDSKAMDEGDRNTKYVETTIDLATIPGTLNAIFYVRKYQPGQTRYNYAKIMLIRNPVSGGFLHGDAPNRHILAQISYQRVADVPYAKTAVN